VATWSLLGCRTSDKVSRKNTSHKDQEISILTIKKNQSKCKTRQCIFVDLPQAPCMGMDQLYTITSPPDFSCCPQYVEFNVIYQKHTKFFRRGALVEEK
jgi:hypothetical protein